MKFLVGDKVRCVDDKSTNKVLKKDKEYIVVDLSKDGRYIHVGDILINWSPDRFELVKEPQMQNSQPFKAGDKVRCIRKSEVGYSGKVGKIYTVKQCTGNSVYLVDGEKLEEFGCMSSRFELVKEQEVKEDSTFKIGDEVYHVNRQEIKYVINFIDSHGKLELDGYGKGFDPSYFRHWPQSLTVETPEVSPEVSEELNKIYKKRGDNMQFKVGDVIKNKLDGTIHIIEEISLNGPQFNSGRMWHSLSDYTLISSKDSKMNSIKSFPKTAAMYTGSAIWRLIKHQANYWVKEPFLLICFKIMRAVRFVVMSVVMAASVAGGVYTYQNADYVKAEVGKYLPTITIEAPEKSL